MIRSGRKPEFGGIPGLEKFESFSGIRGLLPDRISFCVSDSTG